MIDLEAKQIFNFYLIILINDDPDQELPKCRLFKGFTSHQLKPQLWHDKFMTQNVPTGRLYNKVDLQDLISLVATLVREQDENQILLDEETGQTNEKKQEEGEHWGVGLQKDKE